MSGKLKALLLAVVAAVQLSMVVAIGVGPANAANAAVGPADDRQMIAPTAWWTYTGVTAAQVSSLLSSNNARLTEIEVDDPTVPTFTVVMVQNSGAYASGSWWYYGQTAAQVSSLLSANNARLVSAQAYNTGSGVRFAVVMVPNTGANAKAAWWYYGASAALISRYLLVNQARLISLSPYPGGGYLALMVDNTGSNATGWWWYYGVTESTINSDLSANHARLVDLSRNSDGMFNAVMYADPGTRWYWTPNEDLSTAVPQALQLGERIIDVIRYGNSYALVETRNTNALSEKLWNIIAPTIPGGAYGFYFKRVNGPTLAWLQSGMQYEPASALKVLYHAYSIHEESLGNSHDSDVITYNYNPADPTNPGICPDGYGSTSTTNLKNADQQMMWQSDNRATKGIFDKYGGGTFAGGKAVMESYAATLGLTSTQINHDIGCPTSATHNKTTLSDLAKVYEAFQTGKITTNSGWISEFESRMLNQSNYPGFQNLICPIVNQEAASLGKSPAVATSFCNAMTWIAKGGSYQYSGSLPYQVSWDGVSMTGVPYKVNGTITPKYFIFGEFVDGTTISSASQANNINAARSKEYQEAMRPFIHAALATW
jgi:Beta-lactamase enzyme family